MSRDPDVLMAFTITQSVPRRMTMSRKGNVIPYHHSRDILCPKMTCCSQMSWSKGWSSHFQTASHPSTNAKSRPSKINLLDCKGHKETNSCIGYFNKVYRLRLPVSKHTKHHVVGAISCSEPVAKARLGRAHQAYLGRGCL